MKITGVDKSKKYKNRYIIHVESMPAFTISEEEYFKYNIYEKNEITEEEINAILAQTEFASAKALALRFLVLKQHSEKEVFNKLSSESFRKNTILKVIEELKSMGYINDRIFAQKYIFDRSKLKPQSKKMLRFELLNKGIAEEIIDEILSDWQVDDAIIAEGLVKKKFGKYKIDENVLKKIKSFLFHRGFNYDIINETIEKFLQ